MTAEEVQKELRKCATKERGVSSARFFKTSKGQYGLGDIFIGIRNPDIRKVALRYQGLGFVEITKLLNSKIHEERFVALEILVAKYEKGTKAEQKRVTSFYLKHKARVNNWDLVDTSASYILGHYLFDKDRGVLYKLARSKSLWDRRIAVVSTHYFIKQKDFRVLLSLAVILINDQEDLMHKAVGWMLREVGKQEEKALTKFLDKYSQMLPRITLRYSIERLSAGQKRRYMGKASLWLPR